MALSERLAPHLPYLRRYARAITGSQATGDSHVRGTLTALLTGQSQLESHLPPRVALYRLFHATWANAAAGPDNLALPDFNQSASGGQLLSLVASGRAALLLTLLEGFSPAEVGQILQQTPEDVEQAATNAHRAIELGLASRVLIIEDETIIALDLERIVRELGHDVIGHATSQTEALSVALAMRPGLILADINLGEGGSGQQAVEEILRSFAVPVIFVTAYPERLLTGERPEPAYLVMKPFLPKTLQATIGQALFFHALQREVTPQQMAPAFTRAVGTTLAAATG
jgi:CheY-like chemotaxis protein/DNA-directed RNA polymerase specialized sigma24 family protein